MKTLSDKPINLEPPKRGAQIETVNFYSKKMRDLYKQIVEVAASDYNILLVGEQGTGKQYFSRLIHSLSAFSEGPLGELFCNELEEIIQENNSKERENKLKSALEGETAQSSEDFGLDFLSGGTLFFKSFEELSQFNKRVLINLLHNAQKMVKEMEGNRNFRILISAEESYYSAFKEEAFWDELHQQLSPIVIHMPPLRERCEDIPLLIDQFLIDFASKNGGSVHAISPRAVYKCISYHWPGNIRQLKNTVVHAATVVPPGSVITADELPFSIDWKSPYNHNHTTEDMEHTKSYLRAEKLLLKELMESTSFSPQELEKVQYEFRIPFKNRTIFLS